MSRLYFSADKDSKVLQANISEQQAAISDIGYEQNVTSLDITNEETEISYDENNSDTDTIKLENKGTIQKVREIIEKIKQDNLKKAYHYHELFTKTLDKLRKDNSEKELLYAILMHFENKLGIKCAKFLKTLLDYFGIIKIEICFYTWNNNGFKNYGGNQLKYLAKFNGVKDIQDLCDKLGLDYKNYGGKDPTYPPNSRLCNYGGCPCKQIDVSIYAAREYNNKSSL
ncbi:8620_t:CDS:2 [Gigaspora margarita]|uniref:8620_t:CDS:1 n=1 Tax=Gigaspora margarita TaxID=4874 RepID=A0ABN7UCY6_GIGMA|nr:8620_t:CDS:2 [Gigaspora margarita]